MPTGRVLEWNRRATELFGYSREEALGSELAELIVPERYRERHRAGLRRAVGRDGRTTIRPAAPDRRGAPPRRQRASGRGVDHGRPGGRRAAVPRLDPRRVRAHAAAARARGAAARARSRLRRDPRCAGRGGDDPRSPPSHPVREPRGVRVDGLRLARGDAAPSAPRRSSTTTSSTTSTARSSRWTRSRRCGCSPAEQAEPLADADDQPLDRRASLAAAEVRAAARRGRAAGGGGHDHRGHHARADRRASRPVPRARDRDPDVLARLRGDPAQRRLAGGPRDRRLVRGRAGRRARRAPAGRGRPPRPGQARRWPSGCARSSPRSSTPTGASGRILRTGASELYQDIPDEVLAARRGQRRAPGPAAGRSASARCCSCRSAPAGERSA